MPQYQERLKILNAADFGDLLLLNLKLFQENADVLKEYQQRFRYMLVDEYQDTNVAQYLWLRLLAQGHRNICCVGDDDQSIYGWRGAEVDNILRFEKDFPGAKVIRLERNYRSTPHILGAASGLIAHNEGRLGKTLTTEKLEGEQITLRAHWDGDEEARAIGDDIECAATKGRTARLDGHPGARLVPDARLRGPLHHPWRCPTASSAARAFTSAPRSAMRSPISRSPSRPTMTLRLSASSTSPSAASAIPR